MNTEKIGVIVMAAGLSRRLRLQKPYSGTSSKLLLPLGNRLLIDHVLSTAQSLAWGGLIAVVGPDGPELEKICRDKAVPFITNPDPGRGQSTSLALGLNSLPRDLAGYIFLVADQPLVPRKLLQSLADKFACCREETAIVMPVCAGMGRNPVLFGAAWREELLAVTGDQGGRSVMRRHPDAVVELPWPDPRVFLDADTPEDYEALKEIWREME